jgi:enediyne biosynthesis protein E4
MRSNASRWQPVLFLALATAGLVGGGWKWWRIRHDRHILVRAQNALDAGFPALAAKDLIELLERSPGSAEAAFLLGNCEKARGRPQAAALAWAKVASGSPFAFRALEARAQQDCALGHFTEAEQIIAEAGENSQTTTSPDPRVLLGPIYCQLGRITDAMQLIETLWRQHLGSASAASETAINQLRLYIRLESTPILDDTIRVTLDRAGSSTPDDDRIWLAKANLATRSKLYKEAAEWIDLCLKARPTDPAVWRARLDWSMATNRVPEAEEALKHLPADRWNPAQAAKLLAWFAARSAAPAAEQKALGHVLARDPSDFGARERLIDLLVKNGQLDRAAHERRSKDEIGRLQARYQTLFVRNQPRRDAAEMGRLAEQLGRWFEAKAFLSVALALAPQRTDLKRELARIESNAATLAGSGSTLAERLAPELAEIRSESTCKTAKP